MSVARVGVDGAAQALELAPGVPVDLPASPGSFLVPDLADQHPDFAYFFADEESYTSWTTVVAAERLPADAPLVERLVSLPEEHQVALLADGT
nr:hypothetical protein [Polyangiaceae bacterium]